MKRLRSTVEIAVVALLVPLFLALAGLQFFWLQEVGAAERDRLNTELSRNGNRLAFSIAQNINVLDTFFRVDESDIARENWSSFAQRYADWQRFASDPSLVKGFYLIEPSNEELLSFYAREYDPKKNSFVEIADPEGKNEFQRLLAEITARVLRNASSGQERDTQMVMDIPALIIPVASSLGPISIESAWICVILDRDTLESKLLPAIVDASLSLAKDEYNISIVDVSAGRELYPNPGAKGANLSTLAKADFLSSVTTNLVGREPLPSFASGNSIRDIIILNSQNVSDSSVFEKRGRRIDIPTSGLVVAITHKTGSLEQAVRIGVGRNIALAFGILMILGAALVIAFIGYRRARVLREREREFVASVSHELRTPLAVIRSAGENLADGIVSDPEQVKSYGALLGSEGKRLHEMVERVLGLSVVESGRLRGETFPLASLLSEIAESQATAARAKGVELSLENAETSILVFANRDSLGSAIRNLVANGILHGERFVKLSAGLRPVGRKVKVYIEVRDGGKGIPKRECKKIFEAFYRGHAATNAQVPGSGLGLAIAKKAVENSGGKISLESEGGKGCLFTILLPRAEAKKVNEA